MLQVREGHAACRVQLKQLAIAGGCCLRCGRTFGAAHRPWQDPERPCRVCMQPILSFCQISCLILIQLNVKGLWGVLWSLKGLLGSVHVGQAARLAPSTQCSTSSPTRTAGMGATGNSLVLWPYMWEENAAGQVVVALRVQDEVDPEGIGGLAGQAKIQVLLALQVFYALQPAAKLMGVAHGGGERQQWAPAGGEGQKDGEAGALGLQGEGH